MSKVSDFRPGLEKLAWARARSIPGKAFPSVGPVGISYDTPRVWSSASTGATLRSVDLTNGAAASHASLAVASNALGGYVEVAGTLYALSPGVNGLSTTLYRSTVTGNGTGTLGGWALTAAPPTSRSGAGWCAEPNGDLLRIGGNPTAAGPSSAATFNTIERYSNSNNSWNPLPIVLPFAPSICKAVYYAPGKVAVMSHSYWNGSAHIAVTGICFVDLVAGTTSGVVLPPAPHATVASAVFTALQNGQLLLAPGGSTGTSVLIYIDPARPPAEWRVVTLDLGMNLVNSLISQPQSGREVWPGYVFLGDCGTTVNLAVLNHTGL